ncbi:MAG: hypothetical protein HY609_00760 [Deltaproteobacteria bacterium]|nr:hypothetical protein [Deltaproteobacteria bacterium]
MKKLFLLGPGLALIFFLTAPAFAKTKCGYYAPIPGVHKGGYRCFEYPDDPAEAPAPKKKGTTAKQEPSGGCSQLDLTVSCAASGSAVDWINTCSLDCGDGNRYDALAVQKDSTTLSCWHRQVPANKTCSVTVGSGFDSKIVGSVKTAGTCKQTLHGVCAW